MAKKKNNKSPAEVMMDGAVFNPKQFKDVAKKQPKRTQIITKLERKNERELAQDIANWKEAKRRAKRRDDPSWERLIKIFQQVDEDGHVTGIVESIKNEIKSREFVIVGPDGEKDDTATELFETEWFNKYLTFVTEAPFWKYSLIELGEIVDDGFPNIALVPREHVVPTLGIVRKDLHFSASMEGEVFHYLEDPLKPWFIFAGSTDRKDLGLYNKAAPHVIAKIVLFSSAWDYAEVFGQPIRIGQTDIQDDKQRANMIEMMESMGAAPWAVMGHGDKIELKDANKSDAVEVFMEPITKSNEEISKAFAGQVGMFDTKAFVGSAEVQERLFRKFVSSFLRFIKFSTNNELIPRMMLHGILSGDKTFRWVEETDIEASKDWGEITRNIGPFFDIDEKELSQKLGITVTSLGNMESEPQSIANKLNKLYNRNEG